MKKACVSCLVSIGILAAAWPAAAASIWLEPDRSNEVRLEFVKPSFDEMDLTTFSAAWYFSGSFRVGDRLDLEADLPYAHMALDGFDGSGSNTVGNPYLGVRTGDPLDGFFGAVGVRVPLAADDEAAAVLAGYADAVDRWEAFLPDVASLHLGLGYGSMSPEGFGVRLRLAPTIWLDTGDGLADGAEMWLRYSVQLVRRNGPATFGLGLDGRYFATDDSGADFGERSLHELDLFGNFAFDVLRPSVRIRFPLDDDLKRMLDPSLVLGVGVALD